MAELGLSQSGYSESSKVAMYTAYQNRVAAARASMEQAKLTFDNAIREAKLTNDINLAKIAAETLEKSLALSMESVVYLGNLELEKAAAASSINQTYYNRAQEIRDAQQAEIAAAQKEGIGNDGGTDDYKIPGGTDGTGNTGDADFTAVDAFFGDGVSDDAVVEMINAGIITMETVNGVDVYKVADDEKARAYMAEHMGGSPGKDKKVLKQPVSQTEQGANNYSTSYSALKSNVEQIKGELQKAQYDLTAMKNRNAEIANGEYDPAIEKQQKLVDDLTAQLSTATNEIAERPEFKCEKAKEFWEAAKLHLKNLQWSGASADEINAAKVIERNANRAYEEAARALEGRTGKSADLSNKSGKTTLH